MTPDKQMIGLSEVVLPDDREDIIKETFLSCYITEVSANISTLVVQECYSCEIDDPSQRHHDCLMMPCDMRMLTYYDKAKEIIDGKIVMEEFFETLKEKHIELSVLEKAKFTYNNCYNLLCSTPDQEIEIEKRTYQLVSENSFY